VKRIESVLAELDSARRRLLAEIEGLQDPAFSTRPAPGAWSAGHVVEHLARTDEGVARGIAAVTSGKLKIERRPGDWFGQLGYRLGLYRLLCARTSEKLDPAEPLPRSAAAARLAASRAQMLAAIEAGERVGMWSHSLRHPFLGPLRMAEMLSFIAYHEERHRLQIVRIKAALERAGK